MSARAILVGILISIVGAVVIVAVLIGAGAYDFAADAPHTEFVARLIALARERSIDVRADAVNVPPLDDLNMVREGAAHYAEMCVSCHLAPGMQEKRGASRPQPEASRACVDAGRRTR